MVVVGGGGGGGGELWQQCVCMRVRAGDNLIHFSRSQAHFCSCDPLFHQEFVILRRREYRTAVVPSTKCVQKVMHMT